MKQLAGNVKGEVVVTGKFQMATKKIDYHVKVDGQEVFSKEVPYSKNFMVLMFDGKTYKATFQASPKANANAFNKNYDSGKYPEIGAYLV